MTNIKELDHDFLTECAKILGYPLKVYKEYNAKDNAYDYIVFGRMFGKNGRLDVTLAAELADELWALDVLLAQFPEQLMDWFECNTEFGSPWWPLKRSEYTYKQGKWVGAQLFCYIDGEEETLTLMP